MENKIRNTLNEIYFGKTNNILNGLRSVNSLNEMKVQDAVKTELAQALQKRQKDWERKNSTLPPNQSTSIYVTIQS